MSLASSTVPQDLLEFLGKESISKAPRSFRITLSGFPGSGKSTIADEIAKSYGAVVVSPKNVILRAISNGSGERFLPYLENLHLVPTDVLGLAICQRLKEKDCSEKGWILDGFPVIAEEAQLLSDHGITPNRYYFT
jgi:adenylate kinase